jgi:8-oxo-dGTP pyrophosphatase MutT (NUDIX family)
MSRFRLSAGELVGRHHVFDVLKHQVERDGRILHDVFTFATHTDWCNVVPIREDGRIVLVRQHRFGIDAPSLEIPGGLIDEGEAPIDAARRELDEETAHEPATIVPLGVVDPNPAIQSTRLHMFLARGCREHARGQRLEELEDCEVVLVDREELERRIDAGEIRHALVWAALLAWRRLEARENGTISR